MIAVAKITAKGQTTIPQNIRAAPRVGPGNLIAWEVGADGTATVGRVQPMDIEYLRAVEGTLSEWGSAAYSQSSFRARPARATLGGGCGTCPEGLTRLLGSAP